MKNQLILIFFLLAVGCSKNSPDPGAQAPTGPTETRETFSKETVQKAKANYLIKLEHFENSKTEKLIDQQSSFLAFEKDATHYINLLKLSNASQNDIDTIKAILSLKRERFEDIKSNLKKLNDSLTTLEESYRKLNKLKKETRDFQLTRITELGLRDLILETASIYTNTSTFLKLTFESELEQSQIETIDQTTAQNSQIESQFQPYFEFKNLLEKSNESLSKVGFSFAKEDHTREAISSSVTFYKVLEDHTESIETFKKDASIYLNSSDIHELNLSKNKIETTLKKLSDLRTMQSELSNDLQKVRLLGYDLPANIGELKEDELKWKTKTVFLAETLPMQGEWQIGYHIAGQRYNATPGDLITLNNHWYKLVDKETYPAFDDAFGTAFTRIVMYLTNYKGYFSKAQESRFININKLLLDTYTIVTDYIER